MTITDPPTSHLDELLAHRDFVRALARRLVRDANDAEDLEQDTWIAAIRRPPAHRQSLRGWLSRVVRNTASNARVAAERRVRREAALPDRRRSRTPEELAAARGSRAALKGSLAELPEIYREVLLLRFFQGLAPREIAERLALSPETVQTRLKRGLARMRDKLDAEFEGGRRGWYQGLLPWFGAAEVGAGRDTASVARRLLAAACVVAPAGALWFAFPGGRGAEAVASAVTAPPSGAVAPDRAGRQVRGLAPDAERVVVAGRAGDIDVGEQVDSEASLAAGHELQPVLGAPGPQLALEGRVLGPDDHPVAGADIWISSPSRPALGRVVAQSDADGRFRVEHASPRAWIGAVFQGLQEPELRFLGDPELGAPSAGVLRLTLRLAPARAAARRLWVRDDAGRPVEGAHVHLRPAVAFDTRFDPDGGLRLSRPSDAGLTAADGCVVLPDLVRGSYLARVEADDFATAVLELREERASGDQTLGSVRTHELVLTRGVELAGLVRHANGAPARAEVELHIAQIALPFRASTDADGLYRFERVPAGRMVLSAFMPGREKEYSAEHIRSCAPGESARWDPVLRPTPTVEGRLIDAVGAPLAGWTVLLAREHGRSGRVRDFARLAYPGVLARRAVTDAEGRFAWAGCDREASYRLWAARPGAPDEEPAALWPDLRAGQPVELRPLDQESTQASLAGAVLGEGVQARAYLAGVNLRGTRTVPVENGAFFFDDVLPGTYELMLWEAGRLPRGRVEVTLGPGEHLRLPAIELVPPGSVRVRLPLGAVDGWQTLELWEAAEGRQTWRYTARPKDVDRAAGEVLFRCVDPGDYLLSWGGRVQGALRTPVRVVAGEEALVEPLRPGLALRVFELVPPPERPAQGVLGLRLFGADGEVLARERLGLSGTETTARYEVRLPPGGYQLEVHDRSAGRKTYHDFEVGSEGDLHAPVRVALR
ncbi:MAG: sigma-70 family RNA polymerase sigma factor [Planctomycetota bacterium]